MQSTDSRLIAIVISTCLAICFVPAYVDLFNMSFLMLTSEVSGNYSARIPVSISLFILFFLVVSICISGSSDLRRKFPIFLVFFVALSAFYFFWGFSLPRSIQFMLPCLTIGLLALVPRIPVGYVRYIAIVPSLFAIIHLTSIAFGMESRFLEMNHNVFFNQVFSQVYGWFIYSALVVYSETLPVWIIFFVCLLAWHFDQKRQADVLTVLIWIGLLAALILGIVSGRKLFLIFLLLVGCYFWAERKVILHFLKLRVISISSFIFLLFITLNYWVFQPAVSRLISAFATNDLDGHRLVKFKVYVAQMKEAIPADQADSSLNWDFVSNFLVGTGWIGQYHNYFLTMLSAVGITGLLLVVLLFIYVSKESGLCVPKSNPRFSFRTYMVLFAYLVIECFVNVGLSQSYYVVCVAIVLWCLALIRDQSEEDATIHVLTIDNDNNS